MRHEIDTKSKHNIHKPSYFRSNRLKLPQVTNCTEKDIQAIVGQNRG